MIFAEIRAIHKKTYRTWNQDFSITYFGEVFTLRYTGREGHYEVQWKLDHYEMFVHYRQKKVSFFKNNQQIAYIINPGQSLSMKEQVSVLADDGVNLAVLCTLIYAVKLSMDSENELTMAYGESRKFNEEWRPK